MSEPVFRAPAHADADVVLAIAIACDVADFGAPDFDRDALLAEWAEPGVDLAADGFITEGAFGLVLGEHARAWVHPAFRGRGIGAALAARLEARARELGRAQLLQQLGSGDVAGRAMLEGRGYRFTHGYAELTLPDSAVGALPDGPVRPYDPARDEAAGQALIETAFAGGAGRIDPLEVVLARTPDTTLWFVADAPDGGLAGIIRGELRAAGLLTGYVTQVAVAEAHRGRGLAGDLLGAGARALVDAGAMSVRLHVRSSNPGALRLYSRLGFDGGWVVDELALAL